MACDGSLADIYNLAIKKYDVEDVTFIMYDLYKYEHDSKQLMDVRDQQMEFRERLIERFKRCIVTNSGIKVCEACHIKPYNECSEDEKYDIDNGLILRNDLHKLFDEYLLSIDPLCKRLVLSKSLLRDDDYETYHKYHGKQFDILNDKNMIYLGRHHEIFVRCNP
ncbi:MAG: HNH endonuclease [Hyperionvirus sp.]|uniref:HNH endonuclease n=1 Tax=Hyperionvirus sp. TaxID=2487770 RepID=A0A3G5A7C2_9VIRU|nr:MAG: HNH endonuclease [Hyperionvirus sp.]